MFNKNIINNHISKLTSQEKKVAEYAINKGYDLIHLSINVIAKETETSLATVNRTFAKMGYTGFKYFKMFLFSNLKSQENVSNELEFQEKYLLLSIKNTYSSLREQSINNVVKSIIKQKNKQITFICEGFSYFIAKIFSSKLNKIGFDTKFFDENIYNGAFKSKLVIVVSVGFNNDSLLKKINMIKKFNKDVEIIIITTNASIKNKYDYDEVLTGSFVDNFRMNPKELPSDSLVLLLIICNLIFDKIYLKNKKDYDELIEKIKW